jgi:phosphoribosyl 1,2-cyclic phosphodiesterase
MSSMRTLLASDDEAGTRKPGIAGRRSATRLKFYGVRGSVPTPGRGTVLYGGNTSCVEFRANGQIIILDAGTGLRLLGRDLLAEFGQQPLDLTLLLTHTHWDHIQGLPYFLPVYQPQNQLRILGPEGARISLDNVLSTQFESPYFPIGLRQVPANIRIEEFKELAFSLGPVEVQAFFAYHPGLCVGYRLSLNGNSIAFFPDNEIRQAPNRPAAPKGKRPPREFASAENQKLVEFLRGTGVLIMDAQYDSAEYEHHMGWGHGCLDDVVALALEADVKQLFLFHHDPDHTDAKVSQMVSHARQLVAGHKGKLQVEAAQEGVCVELAAVRKV